MPFVAVLLLAALRAAALPDGAQEEAALLQVLGGARYELGVRKVPIHVDALVGKCKNQPETPSELRLENGTVIDKVTLIHIPRTGGSTLELCAEHEVDELRWGGKSSLYHGHFVIEQKTCNKQHIPPNLVPQFEDEDTFCVVRNPYDRILSQLGFLSGYFPHQWSCTAKSLNTLVKKVLPTLNLNPYQEDCHFLPQAAYVMGWNVTEKRVLPEKHRLGCKHVLRFDDGLVHEFNGFMEKRRYPYRLGEKSGDPNFGSPKACRQLSRLDFNADSKVLINTHYAIDFNLFGFGMLSEA